MSDRRDNVGANLESPADAKRKTAGVAVSTRHTERPGFLPFHTNTFDRVFIGAMILIGIHLLWLRFMEPALPIEAATVVSLLIGYFVVRRG